MSKYSYTAPEIILNILNQFEPLKCNEEFQYECTELLNDLNGSGLDYTRIPWRREMLTLQRYNREFRQLQSTPYIQSKRALRVVDTMKTMRLILNKEMNRLTNPNNNINTN